MDVLDDHTHDLDELSDVNITTPADNEILAYDTTSGDFINQTPSEAGLATGSDLVDIRDGGALIIADAKTVNFGTSLTVTNDGGEQVTVNLGSHTHTESDITDLDFDAIDIDTDTTNFDGVLSGTDTTVQAALETIDDQWENLISQYLDGAQVRRTTDYTLTSSWVRLTYDTVDLETDTSVIDWNPSTNKMEIKKDGLYQINYKMFLDANCSGTFYTRAVNEGVEIPGSAAWTQDSNDTHIIGQVSLAQLSAGDTIGIELKRDSGGAGHIEFDSLFWVVKMDGIQGPQGVPGGTDVDIEKDDISVANNVSTINFEGVNVADEGNGKITVSHAVGSGTRDIEISMGSRDYNYAKRHTTNWSTVRKIIFRGTDVLGTPTDVKYIAWVKYSSKPTAIRIYDATNSQIIAETDPFNNTSQSIITDTAISNLPQNEAIFEVQIKSTGSEDYAYISHMTMQF